MIIKRQDYDPSQKKKIINTGKVDYKPKPLYNKNTNSLNDIRISSFESVDFDPRGFVDIPQIQDKPDVFLTNITKARDDARVLNLALSTQLVLPAYDQNGQIAIDAFSGAVILVPYSFRDVLSGSDHLKQNALNLLNNVGDSAYYQQPKYKKMLDLLTKSIGAKNVNIKVTTNQQGGPSFQSSIDQYSDIGSIGGPLPPSSGDFPEFQSFGEPQSENNLSEQKQGPFSQHISSPSIPETIIPRGPVGPYNPSIHSLSSEDVGQYIPPVIPGLVDQNPPIIYEPMDIESSIKRKAGRPRTKSFEEARYEEFLRQKRKQELERQRGLTGKKGQVKPKYP